MRYRRIGRTDAAEQSVITHREMRNQSGEILRAVAAGETVQVSNHGRVAAVISPPNANALTQLVA